MNYPRTPLIRFSVLLLVLGLTLPAAAQSPYRLGWGTDGPIIGAAAGLALTMVAVDRDLPGLTPAELEALSPAEVNAFYRGAIRFYSETASTASSVIEFALIASPLLLLVSDRVRNDAATAGVMSLETLAFAAVLPQIAKRTVDRPRPYAYDDLAPIEKRMDLHTRRSFFSQHTTFAFASAVFLSTLYQDYLPESDAAPFVWVGSLSAAAMVGILRYTSGYHFPTDILLGAAVGAAIGYLIPAMHRWEAAEPESSTHLLPLPGGAVVTFRFRI